jgi:DNA-binding transcriptional LysR family regulator
MLDWDKLRVFHAVAKAQNITRAGEELGLSQSAVSRQIQALEDQLKISLFHRRSRGLLLTEQGELLMKTANDIFQKLNRTETALYEMTEKPSGKLRITVPIAIGTILIIPMIKEFHKLYPDIQLELIIDDRAVDISMREADIAIRLYESREPNVIQRQLASFNNAIYASNDYLRENGVPATLEELQHHTLIGYAAEGSAQPFGDVNWLIHEAQRQGYPITPAISMNSMVGMLRAVKSDIGIAALPDFVVRRARKVSSILPQIEGPTLEAYLVYSEDMRGSRRIRAFRKFLMRKIAEMGIA